MPDLYDIDYPEEVAGHVEAGSFISDDMARTTHGMDDFFTGDGKTEKVHRVDHTGTEAVNKAIGKTVQEAKDADKRRPITNVASSWRTGNVSLVGSQAVRLVTENSNRKDVVVTNQSAALVSIGRDSGLIAGAPNTAYLPAGASRTFEHTQEIWVVGVAGQIVDFVETNYV